VSPRGHSCSTRAALTLLRNRDGARIGGCPSGSDDPDELAVRRSRSPSAKAEADARAERSPYQKAVGYVKHTPPDTPAAESCT
jgi:hypothetical protein